MTQKTISMTLAILFVLPMLCLAWDVEMGEVKLRWKKGFGNYHFLLAELQIANRTNTRWKATGKLLFYDKDGFEIQAIHFFGSIEGMEKKTIHVKGIVSRYDYVKTTTFKIQSELGSFSWTDPGILPVTTERTLTLPPWD